MTVVESETWVFSGKGGNGNNIMSTFDSVKFIQFQFGQFTYFAILLTYHISEKFFSFFAIFLR